MLLLRSADVCSSEHSQCISRLQKECEIFFIWSTIFSVVTFFDSFEYIFCQYLCPKISFVLLRAVHWKSCFSSSMFSCSFPLTLVTPVFNTSSRRVKCVPVICLCPLLATHFLSPFSIPLTLAALLQSCLNRKRKRTDWLLCQAMNMGRQSLLCQRTLCAIEGGQIMPEHVWVAVVVR